MAARGPSAGNKKGSGVVSPMAYVGQLAHTEGETTPDPFFLPHPAALVGDSGATASVPSAAGSIVTGEGAARGEDPAGARVRPTEAACSSSSGLPLTSFVCRALTMQRMRTDRLASIPQNSARTPDADVPRRTNVVQTVWRKSVIRTLGLGSVLWTFDHYCRGLDGGVMSVGGKIRK